MISTVFYLKLKILSISSSKISGAKDKANLVNVQITVEKLYR
jgi:hypothetical protein